MIRLLATLFATLLVTAPALAETGISLGAEGGSVTVTADEMSFSGREGHINFSGNVRVEQSSHTFAAERVSVDLAESGQDKHRQITRMVAEGQVVLNYGDRTATAAHAVYDPNAGTVVLTGTPEVADPGMAIRGRRIIIDLATHTSKVEEGSFTFTEQP
ncbi:MAG: LptA/OstA family protein [Leptospirillia bacterium]